MFNVRLAGGHLFGKQVFTWLSLVVSLMASFVLSFFPLDVLNEIWDLIESVSEGFLFLPTLSYLLFSNCFRLGRKTANKFRPLKVLLNSKVQRRTLLENAKYTKDKTPPNMTRVIISRDLTPLQRNERKQCRQQNPQNQAPQGKTNRSVSVQDDQDKHNENISPIAMETSHRVPSPILDMPHLNLLTHSQMGREQSDVYNDTTILHDETIIGGLLSQHGLEQPVSQIPLMGAET